MEEIHSPYSKEFTVLRGIKPRKRATQHTVIRAVLGKLMRNFRAHRRGT